MNFSIHVGESLAHALEGLAKKSKKTRNALINDALQCYVERQHRSEWPKAVRELAGAAKDLDPFENTRRELGRMTEDPLV